MDDLVYTNLKVVPAEAVDRAVRDFAAALAETPQFDAFEQATEHLRRDPTAQQALAAYQEKQVAWRVLIMLNALSPEQRTELENLQSAFVNHPIVQDYFKAQADFATLCQTLGDKLSEAIGLDYAAACGVSCCG